MLNQDADKLLIEKFQDHYALFSQLTNGNQVVLGQFVESRIRRWLKALVRSSKLKVGTGYVVHNLPTKRGQCDIIIYNGSQLTPDEEDLVVVKPEAAKIVIEVKSTLNIYNPNLPKQISIIKLSGALVYLFALQGKDLPRNDTILKRFNSWLPEQRPDMLIVIDEKEPRMLVKEASGKMRWFHVDTRSDEERSQEIEEVVKELMPALESVGVPYAQAIAIISIANLLYSFAQKVKQDLAKII
jgi:hypothetical protein